jgi:hypothetical protein
MLAVALALFGIQITLAGVVFALTSSPQPAALCAIVGVLVELVALSRADRQRPPAG